MFSQKIDFELIRPFFQNISREKQAQNLFFLAHIVNEINYKSIESIYEKNVCLLKKNNKLLHKCPSMGEIISFFKNININKSNGNKTNTPSQYFFSKGKTLFNWVLSLYEYLKQTIPQKFTKNDWEWISFFFPNSNAITLKCKWFRYFEQMELSNKWTSEQDNALLDVIKKYYPLMFESTAGMKTIIAYKIKWSKVSYEFNKMTNSFDAFKKDCQCRGRWLNHLNPSLNKSQWTLDEDIVLLEKSLITPKKWAKISVHCYGRNQHNIKNRFIALINKEFNFKWEQTKDTMKRCDLTNLIQKTLKSLYVIKNENSAEKTQSKKNTLDDNNSSSNNSISSNHNRSQKAVKYIYGEKNETYEEEKWLDSTFIDYKN